MQWDEFDATLKAFVERYTHTFIENTHLWVSDSPQADSPFITTQQALSPFKTYVQKLECAPESVLFFHGDLHGDVKSLVLFLKHLTQEGFLDSGIHFI